MDTSRWFNRFGFWVVPIDIELPVRSPKLKSCLAALERLRNDGYRSTSSSKGTLSFIEANALNTHLKDYSAAQLEYFAELYNIQPDWQLRELRVATSLELLEAIAEFLRLAEEASSEYGWVVNNPTTDLNWRKHGWKHICYWEITEY